MTSPADRSDPTVRLRPLELADAPRLVDLERRNRAELLVGAPVRGEDWFTETGQRTMIAGALSAAEAGQGAPLGILLEEAGEEVLVGRLSINGVVRGAFSSASLGYWVDRAHTGRGVATAAVRAAVGIAFGGFGLHRLQAEVQVGNTASVRVLERCGFAEYGLAPQYLRLGGRWADCRLFQLVNADWRESAPAAAPTGDGASVRISAEIPALPDVLALYDAVGWSSYTQEPQTLDAALAGSTRVVTARRDGQLIGLARVLSDRATIAYLQDVLVRPSEQGRGVGRDLVEAALAPFAQLRQHVLLTDAEPGQRAFYEALGLTEVHDHPAGLRAFVRLG
ncbi:GNAT family N-acetyltransferase [Brachybacterium hainanense]|uniref:GNAT family N-acetyltransferase n=1 Tax=Brachybacterium hainanense TaxID=1541174 RepID=A0ABV6R9P1_9MICO